MELVVSRLCSEDPYEFVDLKLSLQMQCLSKKCMPVTLSKLRHICGLRILSVPCPFQILPRSRH